MRISLCDRVFGCWAVGSAFVAATAARRRGDIYPRRRGAGGPSRKPMPHHNSKVNVSTVNSCEMGIRERRAAARMRLNHSKKPTTWRTRKSQRWSSSSPRPCVCVCWGGNVHAISNGPSGRQRDIVREIRRWFVVGELISLTRSAMSLRRTAVSG